MLCFVASTPLPLRGRGCQLKTRAALKLLVNYLTVNPKTKRMRRTPVYELHSVKVLDEDEWMPWAEPMVGSVCPFLCHQPGWFNN